MTNYIFGKFPNESKNFTKKRFLVTTDEQAIKKWKSSSTSKKPEKKVVEGEEKIKNITAKEEFSNLNLHIFETFIGFYEIVPFLMMSSSVYPNMILEEEIIKKFSKTGKIIEKDDVDSLYQLNFSHYSEILKSIKKWGRLQKYPYCFQVFILWALWLIMIILFIKWLKR